MTIKEAGAAMRKLFAKPEQERLIANVRVGLAQGEQSASAHVPGVKQGNAPARGKRSHLEREAGIHSDPNGGARATARRSTGINAKAHDPIDPRMPNLPPP
jgi:hypothetical protein